MNGSRGLIRNVFEVKKVHKMFVGLKISFFFGVEVLLSFGRKDAARHREYIERVILSRMM